MNRKLMVVLLCLFVLLFVVTLVSAATSNELRTCRKEVTLDYKNNIKVCNDGYKEQRLFCVDEKNTCKSEVREEKSGCYDTCSNMTNSSRSEVTSCRRTCSENYTQAIRACSSDYKDCRLNASGEKNTCRTAAKAHLSVKRALCSNEHVDEESRYTFSQEECTNAGGFFQQLCKGPYFGIVCTQDIYCQCGGATNYTCPVDSVCNEEHGIKIRGRGHSLPGFRSLLGESLGDVGVCVRNELNAIFMN